MSLDLADAKALLGRTPAVLDALLRGLPEPWMHENEGPDTWSAFDVVWHLIEAEATNWIPRARHLLAHGESAAFPPFDRFGFADKAKGRSIPCEDYLGHNPLFAMADLWRKCGGTERK